MKRLGLLLTAAAVAASVSAQTVTESKSYDNVYIGINGGVTTKSTGHSWMDNLNPNAGLRLGRNFTPVFGLTAESNAYFSNKPYESTGTAVRALNTSLLGTVNLSNWFGGYPGEPRGFEVVGLFGYGWGHLFGNTEAYHQMNHDNLTSKAAIDFVFNLGSNKAWQFYVEPAIVWALNGDGTQPIEYNLNKSFTQLNCGFVYKFPNSNGTNNFTIAKLRDQSEIDGLNAQINSLRNDLSGKNAQLTDKDRQISDLQKALDDCNKRKAYVKPATATNLQPTVLFRQGQSVVDRSQMPNIELIANYMKNHKSATVTIKGYASPEGPTELNQRLSENRAKNVKNLLVDKYRIAPNRLKTVGMGETNKLFKELDFNRVATFNDDTNVE